MHLSFRPAPPAACSQRGSITRIAVGMDSGFRRNDDGTGIHSLADSVIPLKKLALATPSLPRGSVHAPLIPGHGRSGMAAGLDRQFQVFRRIAFTQ